MFDEFNEEKDRLDHFYFQKVGVNNYKTLAFVIKVIPTISHGQAFVEREFSVNNVVPGQKMKEDTIVARKHISHFRANNVNRIEIDKALLSSVRGASSTYKIHLEEMKKEKLTSDAINQKLLVSNEWEI